MTLLENSGYIVCVVILFLGFYLTFLKRKNSSSPQVEVTETKKKRQALQKIYKNAA